MTSTGVDLPFLVVSMEKEVVCCKCGAHLPAPGRVCYHDGENVRYWCDCVTEGEVTDIALDFARRRQLELAALDRED